MIMAKTISQILEVSIDDFSSMTKSELSKIVSKLSSAANKRLKRMAEEEIESPAYSRAMKSGGKFGAKDKTLNQLRAEFMRVSSFLKMKTSTLRGYKKVVKEFKERVGITEDLTEDDLKSFWELHREFAKYIAPFIRGSVDIQKIVADVWTENKDKTFKEQSEAMRKKLETEYMITVSGGSNDTSRFINI